MLDQESAMSAISSAKSKSHKLASPLHVRAAEHNYWEV